MKDTMLIIENNDNDCIMLQDIFCGEYSIMQVNSGEKALDILAENYAMIKIILLNLMLPGMSGFEFIEKKNNHKDLFDIPIVIISNSNSVEEQIQCFKMGVHEFITKPFIPEIVEARINNVINHHHRINQVEDLKTKVEDLKIKVELDEMTGVYNKSSVENIIQTSLQKDEGKLDVLLVIDIDHFKTVNDTLGHQIGDKVIKTIVNIITGLVRKTDIIGRIGGDEFCVLMKDVPNMDIVYSKLRELCQIMKYKPSISIPEYVTLSIGAVSNERQKTTYANLFNKADDALYKAKEAGKAQFRVYGDDSAANRYTANNRKITNNSKTNKEDMVVIVDDESITRGILRNILETDYNVVEAENGLEAMKLINANKSKTMVVILDLIMPIMNGYQVLDSMKRDNDLKSIPIIISTSDNSEESDLRILNLGASLIVHKPLNTVILLKQIENQLESYRERKREVKQNMLQNTMIGSRANTFLCTYHFNSNEVEIGENYLKYVSEDFPKIFAQYPFDIESFVLPADYEKANDFFRVTNNKSYDKIEIRFRVGNARYEWFEINKMINYDEMKNVESVIFMFLHIEYAVEAKQDLLFMANNDILTHIPNMRTFYDEVSEMINNYSDEKFVMITGQSFFSWDCHHVMY